MYEDFLNLKVGEAMETELNHDEINAELSGHGLKYEIGTMGEKRVILKVSENRMSFRSRLFAFISSAPMYKTVEFKDLEGKSISYIRSLVTQYNQRHGARVSVSKKGDYAEIFNCKEIDDLTDNEKESLNIGTVTSQKKETPKKEEKKEVDETDEYKFQRIGDDIYNGMNKRVSKEHCYGEGKMVIETGAEFPVFNFHMIKPEYRDLYKMVDYSDETL